MKPTLVVLAAGMGSRYGGLKQIDSIGPSGEIIIDYSIHDAIKAGFGKVVFIIRHFFEDAFRDKIGKRVESLVPASYVFQELESGLNGAKVPARREKPWGTAHAIMIAEGAVKEPFAVINADDYYGPHAFEEMAEYLQKGSDYSMIGYKLKNTLSEYGTVARGVCRCTGDLYLEEVIEHKRIAKNDNGAICTCGKCNNTQFSGEEIVSMNLWGFHPTIFAHLKEQFENFMTDYYNDPRAEFLIPNVVDSLIHNEKARVKVLPSNDSWFGITYKADKKKAIACINGLIEEGRYPPCLWSK